MSKSTITTVVVAVVVGAAGFFGGMQYQKGKGGLPNFQSMTQQQRQQFAQELRGSGGGTFAGRRNGMGGAGFTAGQIISKDSGSVTIKMPDGSTKIVLLSGSTQVAKSDAGTANALAVGDNIVVSGGANSDGSVIAQTIQIRPAMAASSAPQAQ